MKEIRIRLAERKDFDELMNVFSITITRNFEIECADIFDEIQADLAEEIDYKRHLLTESLLNNDSSRLYLIATIDNKIVGAICHGPCSDVVIECADRNVDGLHEVGSAYVLPEYQRSGIGTILFNSIITIMIGKGIDEFCLDSGYSIAKKIWSKKLGRPNVIKKDYWGEGVDHHIWFRKTVDVELMY